MLRVIRQLLSVPKFNPMKLFSDNRSVAGVNMGHLDGEAAMLAEELRAVLELYEAGVVKPQVDAVVPFSESAVALRRLQEGKNVGKVVLVP